MKFFVAVTLFLFVHNLMFARLKDQNLIKNIDYYEKTQTSKYDWDEKAASLLVLENINGALTTNEIQGLKNYLLSYQLPTHNYMNYYFRKRMNSYMMEWVYKKDEDIRLINKSIDFAQRAIDYRNDNICKQDKKFECFQISFDRSVAPVWPNYKEAEEYSDGTVGLAPGASAFAGLTPITVAARMILSNKNIWKNKYNGKSYYDIALYLMTEAMKTIDYVHNVFVKDDNLIRYPYPMLRSEWCGKVFITNRILPFITGSIPLVDCYEILNIQKDEIKKIDKVNQAMIDKIKAGMVFYEKGGQSYVHYPYSEEAALKVKNSDAKNGDKVQSEDFTHGSFDSRDFQLIYLSNRYHWGQKEIESLANDFVDIMADHDRMGWYNERMNGKGKVKQFKTPISFDGYIWYATYRPEIYKHIDYLLKNGIMKKGDKYDAYLVYEVLKLKEIASNKVAFK